MPNIQRSVDGLSLFEKFSQQQSCVHNLHPAVKILGTLVYIGALVSFERHTVSAMLPFVFYPLIMAPLAGIPLRFLFSRALFAAPFVFFAGLGNVFFERPPAYVIGNLVLSAGVLSLASLVLRAVLCVSAAVLLASVTTISGISAQLRRFGVPALPVMLFEMTFRYIGVLGPEAAAMHTAYHLRGGLHRAGHPEYKKRGVDIKHFGMFAGSFFLRTLDRSERIYAAMKCRGYSLDVKTKPAQVVKKADVIFFAALVISCALCRAFDLPLIAGEAILSLYSML
ncbi:MAG: cobalt ECF transporter T component CbiQ [Treponema sp.]|jgi:cobalt/nickel transport system permease protein|nr:cobalt ECF transporter T component CbiQ [Treponema sp.]